MKNTEFKLLLIMLFGLFATACTEDAVNPADTIKPFHDWEQSGIGVTWFYNYQNEYLATSGGQQSKLISNPAKTPKGNHTITVEVDNRSLVNDAKIYLYAIAGDRTEGLGGFTMLPGKVSYEVQVYIPMPGKISLQAVGDSFTLDVLSVRVK